MGCHESKLFINTTCTDIPTAQISSVFLTVTDSSDAKTKLLECSRGSIETDQSFKCEFCYSFGRSCQSSLTCVDVIPGSESATLLPSSLAEGTYCYRATAIVDESPAKMIQDTFTIHPCQNTGTYTMAMLKMILHNLYFSASSNYCS